MKDRFGLRTIFIPIGAIAAFLVIQMITMTLYSFVIMLTDDFGIGGTDVIPDPQDFLARHSNQIGLIYSIIIIIAAVSALNVLSVRNKNAVWIQKLSAGHVVSSMLLMLGCAGVISLEMTGIYAIGEKIPYVDKIIQDYIEMSEAFIGDGNIVMIILSTCIFIPIAEELIFRGVIQGELRRAMPAWAAITIQAVVFALIHGNLLQISYVIIPAFILGIAYEWTKSIYVPIAMHMIFNFLGAALPEILNYNETAMMYLSIIEFAFIPVGIIAFFYLKAIRKTDTDEQDVMPGQLEPGAQELPVRDSGWVHRDI